MHATDADPIYLQAVEWFLRLQDKSIDTGEIHAFETWFGSDPRHAAAFDRAAALWDRFDVIKPEYERLRRETGTNRRSLLLGSVALLAAVPGLLALSGSAMFADYRTDIGERLAFTLPDGSLVELGSYSALSLDFGTGERRVELHRGQANFQVAKETNRPFVVTAADGLIRALGTQFDVKCSTNLVTVAVVESSIELRVPGAAATIITEGWQISYGSDGMRQPVEVDARAVQAWRQDRMVFEDVSLRLVLGELERYRRGRILLMDESIGGIPVTAIFKTADGERALRVMEQTLPIRVMNLGYLTLVYPS